MVTKKEVREYAYDLVSEGKSQYHMLDEYEKSVLTGLIINSTDKIHVWEYITEADYKNELPEILGDWLTLGSNDNPSNILDSKIINTIKNNAILYASKEAIKVLEEQQQEWEYNKKFNFEE